MATTVPLLKSWFDQGKADPNVTHMIIKHDSFDGEDYPVYVKKGESSREVSKKNPERTMECYSMNIDWATQAAERRASHWD